MGSEGGPPQLPPRGGGPPPPPRRVGSPPPPGSTPRGPVPPPAPPQPPRQGLRPRPPLARVGLRHAAGFNPRCHSHPAPFAAATKARTFAASLTPPVSTPLETSTPHGRTVRTAATTFSGDRPPASQPGGAG